MLRDHLVSDRSIPDEHLALGEKDGYRSPVTCVGIGSASCWCWRSSVCICLRPGQVRATALL